MLWNALERKKPDPAFLDPRVWARLRAVSTLCWKDVRRFLKARRLRHAERRARQLREYVANPQGMPCMSAGAKEFITGKEEIRTQGMLVQQQSNERNAAIAAHMQKENECSGPFAVGMRRVGGAFVISNAVLMAFMEGGQLDEDAKEDEEEVLAMLNKQLVAMLNNQLVMNFPVHRDAAKRRNGRSICATVSSCLRRFESTLAQFLEDHPKVQMVFIVAVDLIVWPMPPGMGSEPDALLGSVLFSVPARPLPVAGLHIEGATILATILSHCLTLTIFLRSCRIV